MLLNLNNGTIVNPDNSENTIIRNILEDTYMDICEYFRSISCNTYQDAFNIYHLFEVINMEYNQPILMFSRFSQGLHTGSYKNYILGVVGNNYAQYYKTDDPGNNLGKLIEDYEMLNARINILGLRYPYIENIRSGKDEELPNIQYKRGEFIMNTILKLLKYLGYKYTHLIDASNIKIIDDNEYYNVNLKIYTHFTKGRSWYNKFGFVNRPNIYYELLLSDTKRIFNESITIINQITLNYNEYDKSDPHVIIIGKAKGCIKNKYYWNTLTYERFTQFDIITVYKYASIISLLPSVFYLKNKIMDRYLRFECRFGELTMAIDNYYCDCYHNLSTINICEMSQSYNVIEEDDRNMGNIFLEDIEMYITDNIKKTNEKLLDNKMQKNNRIINISNENINEMMKFDVTQYGYLYKDDLYKIMINTDNNTNRFITENNDISSDTLRSIMIRIQNINTFFGLDKFSLCINATINEYIHYYLIKSLLVDDKNIFSTYGYDTKTYDMHILKILEPMNKYTIKDVIILLEMLTKQKMISPKHVGQFREITYCHENNKFVDIFIQDNEMFKNIVNCIITIPINFKYLDNNDILVFPELVCNINAITEFLKSTHIFTKIPV